jgi:siroheme synthase (precorrin-2 oxidase/ferrochelatase)
MASSILSPKASNIVLSQIEGSRRDSIYISSIGLGIALSTAVREDIEDHTSHMYSE